MEVFIYNNYVIIINNISIIFTDNEYMYAYESINHKSLMKEKLMDWLWHKTILSGGANNKKVIKRRQLCGKEEEKGEKEKKRSEKY